MRGIVQTAISHFGTIDIVVNNAGIIRNGYLEDITVEKLDAVLDVDLPRLVFSLRRPRGRHFAKGYGKVGVMISSAEQSCTRLAGTSNYAAAKAGVFAGLAKALANEGAPPGLLAISAVGGAMFSIDTLPPST